jgi:CBS domain-containing protein
MLFRASDPASATRPLHHSGRATGAFAPLRQWTAKPGERFRLPVPNDVVPVSLDSAASEVMTDLRRVGAIIVDDATSIEDANHSMIARRVRALFVVDETREVLGIVTATDILGERPIRFTQERGIRHNDVLVRDIMTPADRLEILDLHEVQRARVGDIVATLKRAGRQHALVVEAIAGSPRGETWVRGIFSLTRIARQLGLPDPQSHDIPRTFAEVEAIVGP